MVMKNDSMNGIVYIDDGLICYEGVKRKFYGTTPGIYITLKGI